MAKVNKSQLATALLETWKISDEINVAVGLTTDSDEQLPHQIEIAFGEFKEGILAIKDFNEEEIYDVICDLNVTVVPCAMMYAGNKSLLDEPHPYELNPEGKDFNELIHDAQREFLSTKYGVRHFASCVDFVCDLSAAMTCIRVCVCVCVCVCHSYDLHPCVCVCVCVCVMHPQL